MKKFTFILTLILSTSFSYGQWEWQKPYPQGNNLKDIFFVNQDVGWAVGSHGTIVKTGDGGETFEVAASLVDATLHGVEFFNTQTGFVVGDGGLILRTTDGGSTWNIVLEDSTFNLNDICLIGQEEGWIVGSEGVIFRTTDGGTTWEKKVLDTACTLNSVSFVDPMHGWLGGLIPSDNGVLLYTSDGGQSWIDLYDGTLGFQTICFPDLNNGWSVADGKVYKTSNGGLSWEFFLGGPGPGGTSYGVYINLFFLSPDTGWVVGIDDCIPWACSILAGTTDGGDTWEGGASGTRDQLEAVYFTDADHGCVGGVRGQITVTSDGGATWDAVDEYTTITLNSTFFLDDLNGWALGGDVYPPSSMILHTSDGGVTWEELQTPPYPDSFVYTSAFFITPLEGWVVGGFNMACKAIVIIHTEDGGVTWESQYKKTMWWNQLKDVHFTGQQTGWAVGGGVQGLPGSCILHTTDGGDNWDEMNGITAKNLSKVCFPDQNNGWIVGEGTILHTNDGGATWEEQWSGNYFIKDLCFIDLYHGWAVGGDYYSGYIVMQTIDGGVSWEEQPTPYSVESISFINVNQGYISSYEGVILYSDDGGNHWNEQFSTDTWLTGICAAGTQNVWVTGGYGTILHLDNGGSVGEEESRISNLKFRISNYPNPFSSSTTIEFELEEPGAFEIFIVNQVGQIVGKIYKENGTKGINEVTWYANGLPSGFYYYSLVSGESTASGKMIIFK